MSSSVHWECDSLQRVGDLVPHCDSGVLEAGMSVHSVELYPLVRRHSSSESSGLS